MTISEALCTAKLGRTSGAADDTVKAGAGDPVAPRALDTRAIPYRLPQPADMQSDVFIAAALELEGGDDRLWVAQAPGVSFRPLIFGVAQGYYVNLLRVRASGILSRHRHGGPVHAFTLRGEWHYLEHDWIARAGDYAFEPAGETHTLVIPDGVDETVTLFHVSGGYTYVDPEGVALGYEDVFTKLANARRHYEAIGLGADYAERFIR
jgi:quercetin dioxygenase-like cupin family protein